MNPEFDEVLLTAYLDEEVTDIEREAVEEQLRISESSRKLLEELRSVRSLVMQLHQTQPGRSFQSGPWNASAVNGDSATVVLNKAGSKWSWSYQKLASLAALIAIVICGSVLIIQPNGMFLGRSENRSLDSGIELRAHRAPQPTDQSVLKDRAGSGGSVSMSMSNELEGGSKSGANPTEDAQAKSEDAALPQRSLRSSRGAMESNSSASGGGGAAPPGALSKAPMAKKQSADIENFSLGDPAPSAIVAAPPSFGMLGELNQTEASLDTLNPKVQSLLQSLFADSPDSRDNWIAINPVGGDNDTSGAKIDPTSGIATPTSLGRSLAIDSTARYSFRYQRAAEKDSFVDKAVKKEKRFESPPATELSMQSELYMQSELKTKTPLSSTPLLIEFQIPRGEWEAGGKRLRELGIGVPVETPSLDYVDFYATQSPTMRGATESPDNVGATTEPQASRWSIRLAEPDERLSAADSPTPTDKSQAPSAAFKELTDSSSVWRIRVRALEQE